MVNVVNSYGRDPGVNWELLNDCELESYLFQSKLEDKFNGKSNRKR